MSMKMTLFAFRDTKPTTENEFHVYNYTDKGPGILIREKHFKSGCCSWRFKYIYLLKLNIYVQESNIGCMRDDAKTSAFRPSSPSVRILWRFSDRDIVRWCHTLKVLYYLFFNFSSDYVILIPTGELWLHNIRQTVVINMIKQCISYLSWHFHTL